jgi:hypothetical protein
MNSSFSITKELSNLDPQLQTDALKKLGVLKEKMARDGCTLRDDSRLAFRFSTESLPPPYTTVEDVSHELYCIDEIHRQTTYQADSQTGMRSLAKYIHEDIGLPWGDAWIVTKEYGADLFKYRSMHQSAFVLSSLSQKASWADECE